MTDEEIVKYLKSVAEFQYNVIDKTVLIAQLNQLQVSLFQLADSIATRTKNDNSKESIDCKDCNNAT